MLAPLAWLRSVSTASCFVVRGSDAASAGVGLTLLALVRGGTVLAGFVPPRCGLPRLCLG